MAKIIKPNIKGNEKSIKEKTSCNNGDGVLNLISSGCFSYRTV